ncbi:hypothetical protein ACTFIV_002086 [Dictyostelium citrinum]
MTHNYLVWMLDFYRRGNYFMVNSLISFSNFTSANSNPKKKFLSTTKQQLIINNNLNSSTSPNHIRIRSQPLIIEVPSSSSTIPSSTTVKKQKDKNINVTPNISNSNSNSETTTGEYEIKSDNEEKGDNEIPILKEKSISKPNYKIKLQVYHQHVIQQSTIKIIKYG